MTRPSNGNAPPARAFSNAPNVRGHPRFWDDHGKDHQARSFRQTMDTTSNSDAMPNPTVPDPAVATLKLPDFWVSDSELWFLSVDPLFRRHRATSQAAKYAHVICSLTPAVIAIVAEKCHECRCTVTICNREITRFPTRCTANEQLNRGPAGQLRSFKAERQRNAPRRERQSRDRSPSLPRCVCWFYRRYRAGALRCRPPFQFAGNAQAPH
ncbi:hypothetical protein HPB52_021166 [Rhipicephalus sanguineus]|uniref:DUF7041 domain-containing protein n=1 Tax=Rhipicephalus sanguineus TaxID=34632 RepID=A0A9D4QBP7_RHISA|nr:hypothetical protein HPB52_021166 [Rhipicephalus sanguineus]